MIRIFLKLAVSLSILALLFWLTDAQTVMTRLRGLDLRWFGLGLISLTMITFLMALRWQMVAQRVGIALYYGQAVREYYIAQLVNMVLPGGVAGDVGRALRIRRDGDLTRAAQSVAAERLVGQCLLFGIMGAGFAAALLIAGGPEWPVWAWLGPLVLSIIGAAVVMVSRGDHATARFCALIVQCLKDWRILGVSILIALLLIGSLYCATRATGTVMPAAGWFTVLPLVLSSMVIPLSIGGWGWREGAAAAVFPVIGASASAGVAMGIAYGAMLTIAALPAIAFLPGLRERQTDDDTTFTKSKI